MSGTYLEPGGSWRSFWWVAGALAVLLVLDALLPGPDIPALLFGALVLGGVGAGCLSARRIWTVRVGGRGDEAALTVGRDRVALTDVDAGHLRAVLDGRAGVDAGAPVLGGGWSVPKGRTGLPLRRTDGQTLLVPTRAPRELTAALLAAHPSTAARTGGTGTLGP